MRFRRLPVTHQRSPDTGCYGEAMARWEGSERDQRAADWRRARRLLKEMDYAKRKALLAYWQRCGWPGDPVYLLCLVNMQITGRFDPRNPHILADERY